MNPRDDLPKPARKLNDLGIWRMAQASSDKVFTLSETFPDVELECEHQGVAFGIRQSSLLVCIHVIAAWRFGHWRKRSRLHVRAAAKLVIDTLVWLEYASDRGFLGERQKQQLYNLYVPLWYRLRRIARHPQIWRKVFRGPDSLSVEDGP